MKKILQISKYMYPFIGGTEQVARDIANAFCNNDDIQQKIICFNEDAENEEFICHRGETVKEMVDDVEVIRCGCITKIASQSISMTYPRELKKVFREFKPDIVILHYPNPYVSFFLLRILKENTKLILYWHLDITKQRVLGKLFHRQTIRLLKRADQVIATSPNYIDGSPYLKRFHNKCDVIPNCINQERLAETREAKRKAANIRQKYEGKIICFAVGRHVPYKGMEYLIRASKLLDERFIFLIGGTGELSNQLQEEAKSDKKVRFLGHISDDDLIAYYTACDIFTFPSITKNEAFGIALAEGMYFGKPAVTFTIPGSGVNYVNLNGVTGIECANRDSEAYAEALIKLADNREMCMTYGRNARQRVLDNFTQVQFDKSVIKLIS